MNPTLSKQTSKIITKGRKNKNTKSTDSLIQKLRKNGVPSSILSSVTSLNNPNPEEFRTLTFEKSVSCKSMSLLAKMQNIETLQMSMEQSA